MQSLKIDIRFYLIFVLFSNCFKSLIAPFWLIYLNKIGLTFEQISFLVITNHIAVVLFEIPTGAIADTYGRKFSVALSLMLSAITSIGIYFTTSFSLLLLFFTLSGLGATFMSGAFDSWFAESCYSVKKDIDLTKYWGKLTSFSYLGGTLGFLLGSVLIHYNILREIWLIEGIGIFLVLVYTVIAGKESTLKENTEAHRYQRYWEKIVKGSKFIFNNRELLVTVCGSSFFFFSSGIVSLLWQPYFNAAGISLVCFGPILASTMIISIFVPRGADKITKMLGGSIYTLMSISLTCSLFLFAMYISTTYSFVPYIIYVGTYSLHTPIFMAYFNKFIPSSERATIISTYNQFISVSTILATYLFGFVSDSAGLHAALLLSTIVCIISSLFFVLLLKFREEGTLG